MKTRLYIVATPIGNLQDITYRAIETLKEVDLIACEDTRHTRKLLSHYKISTELTSYFEYNKVKKASAIIRALNEGKNIALVSDAGTPAISDPGYRVVRAAIDAKIEVVPIPGPSAIIASLVASGMPTDRFIFEGFLPNKSAARRKRLETFLCEKRTVVIYESPHRVLKCLVDIRDLFGSIEVVCARELTKKFEEMRRGSAQEMVDYFTQKKPKGEFVILFNPKMKI